MHFIQRKSFLKKFAFATIGALIAPRFSFSGKKMPRMSHTNNLEVDRYTRMEIKSTAIIDMHCHPSLGMYMSNNRFWKRHHPVAGGNLFHMQEDLHQLSYGNVKGLLATHYLPEATIKREWATVKSFFPVLRKLLSGMVKKLEHEDFTNHMQVLHIMQLMEHQLAKANKKQDRVRFVIARSYEEFENALRPPASASEPYTIPFAHAIEGSHALGRIFPVSEVKQKQEGKNNDAVLMDASAHISSLMTLKDKGVCLMSLAHFFRNDLVYPVDGIAPHAKKTPAMAWQYTPDQDRKLTYIGEEVVRKMFEIGMIVDLTHSAPAARADVFRINTEINILRETEGKCKRPVVFSHTGAQQIFEYYNKQHHPYYKYYNASDEEILAVEKSGGLIGVIPENFWLVGADTHMRKQFPPYQFRRGISYMLQTMKYINSKTEARDFSTVAIGTDFDGLADNPKDLYKPQQLTDLFEAMLLDPELKDHIEKITWRNALRVLKCGWGTGAS